MIQVAIVKRRLKPGKTYEDFRKAWYHTVGFDTANKMLTVINVADPSEVIVIGMNEVNVENIRKLIAIDIAERAANPLDDIIEPEIDRTFGLLVAEDDFSAAGKLDYKPPAVNGTEIRMADVDEALQQGAQLLAELRALREQSKAGQP